MKNRMKLLFSLLVGLTSIGVGANCLSVDKNTAKNVSAIGSTSSITSASLDPNGSVYRAGSPYVPRGMLYTIKDTSYATTDPLRSVAQMFLFQGDNKYNESALQDNVTSGGTDFTPALYEGNIIKISLFNSNNKVRIKKVTLRDTTNSLSKGAFEVCFTPDFDSNTCLITNFNDQPEYYDEAFSNHQYTFTVKNYATTDVIYIKTMLLNDNYIDLSTLSIDYGFESEDGFESNRGSSVVNTMTAKDFIDHEGTFDFIVYKTYFLQGTVGTKVGQIELHTRKYMNYLSYVSPGSTTQSVYILGLDDTYKDGDTAIVTFEGKDVATLLNLNNADYFGLESFSPAQIIRNSNYNAYITDILLDYIVCDPTANKKPKDLDNYWSQIKAYYDSQYLSSPYLMSGGKNVLKNGQFIINVDGTVSPKSGSPSISQREADALYKYEYLVSKYDLNNFMNRVISVSVGSQQTYFVSNNGPALFAIALSILISVGGLGFILIKKRKRA